MTAIIAATPVDLTDKNVGAANHYSYIFFGDPAHHSRGYENKTSHCKTTMETYAKGLSTI